jgi:gluconolactonase
MAVESLDAAFDALVDSQAKLLRLGSGFVFTEGPVWHPRDQHLLFSDIPASTRYRYDGENVVEQAKPSNMGNGMTYDADLNLLVCEQETFSLVRFRGGAEGAREVVARHFHGVELNSPNDVIVGRDGSIYFSDPTYGRMLFGAERPSKMGFQGIYRVPPGGGAPELLVERNLFTQPNGLCFSPDESLLYVNDSEQANIRVFDAARGRLGNMRVFASDIVDPARPGVPDGMKCDARGNVWVTAPGGLWVFSPAGNLIGKVAVAEVVGNFHWGGRSWRTLYITATTSLYALEVKVGPHPESFMLA